MMKKRIQYIILSSVCVVILYSETFAAMSLQSFWTKIDNMPIQQRIDFYEKAIQILQKVQNNPQIKDIAYTIQQKKNKLENQHTLEEIQNIPNINYREIQNIRIEKHNTIRTQAGIEIINNNDKLNKTAQNRANYLAANTIPSGNTHKRNNTDGYYDYNTILKWFSDQGIGFTDTGSTAFSENIGYGYYNACKETDCTQALLKAIESTRNFFIGEKAKNGPHYRAIVEDHFSQIGIGIARNSSTKRYYIVVHYGSKIIDF